jgi:hypothetical protein
MKNISSFKNFKILYSYSKQKIGSSVIFCTDDPDEWLIDIITYRNKSGVITSHDVITADSMNHWKKYYEDHNYIFNKNLTI